MSIAWARLGTALLALVVGALAGCSPSGGDIGPTVEDGLAMPTQGAIEPSQSPLSGQWVSVIAPTGSVCVDLRDAQWTALAAAALTVAVGQDLAVALVVPQEDVSSVFPWDAPETSDPEVLRGQDTVCPGPMPHEPIRTFLFRAVKPGTAEVRAALAPDWAPPSWCQLGTRCPVLEPLTLDVTVPGG
jgi:hypothetical protein